MERREAARAYLDGQLSRRVFLRRMVALGIALPAAIAYADLLMADPARAIAYDYYVFVTDFEYQPDRLRAGLGKVVQFGFDAGGSNSHSATDPTRVINTGFKAPGNVFFSTMYHSGTYEYRCREKTHTMKGTVRVPIKASKKSASAGTTIDLEWSTVPGGNYTFDVQRKRPTGSTWQDWKVGTTELGDTVTLNAVGTHRYRCRSTYTINGKVSGWSPTLSIEIA